MKIQSDTTTKTKIDEIAINVQNLTEKFDNHAKNCCQPKISEHSKVNSYKDALLKFKTKSNLTRPVAEVSTNSNSSTNKFIAIIQSYSDTFNSTDLHSKVSEKIPNVRFLKSNKKASGNIIVQLVSRNCIDK